MFCSLTQNNAVNHIHERALRLTHNNYSITFCDILVTSNEKPFHQKYLTKEIYKFASELHPPIMNDFSRSEKLRTTEIFSPSIYCLLTFIYLFIVYLHFYTVSSVRQQKIKINVTAFGPKFDSLCFPLRSQILVFLEEQNRIEFNFIN